MGERSKSLSRTIAFRSWCCTVPKPQTTLESSQFPPETLQSPRTMTHKLTDVAANLADQIHSLPPNLNGSEVGIVDVDGADAGGLDDLESQVAIPDLLIQLGVSGQVGRCRAVDRRTYRRGQQVLCRTARGLEVGLVLATARPIPDTNRDGTVIRQLTSEDQLLWQTLRHYAQDAFEECQRLLLENQFNAALTDVEPLLDGKTLYFHFAGPVPTEVETMTQKLAEVFERRVRRSRLAELLEHGCGPGCGTENAKNGCGTSGGCATCVVKSACKK